jgi:hypothetical protein
MDLTDRIAEAEMEKVRKYALAHRFDLEKVKAIAQGVEAGPGDNPLFVMNLPKRVRVVFSIEQHPGGWMNHMAISIEGKATIDQLGMALACHISRPLGPKQIKKADEVLVYTSADKTERHYLIPFVDPDVDKTTISA